MARPSNYDPLDKFRWKLEIYDGSSNVLMRSGFTTTEAPGVTFNTKEYPEGGNHLHPRLIIESATNRPITLTRGVTYNQDFYNWISLPYYTAGAKMVPAQSQFLQNPGYVSTNYRRTVVLSHLDRTSNIVKYYVMYNAIPVEFQGSSDFVADSDDGVSIEKVVIKYESFEVVSAANNQNNPFSLQDITQRIIKNL